MSESNFETRNDIIIDKSKAKKMIRKIIYNEIVNHRTKSMSDNDIVQKHIESIREELHAYQEN